MIDIAMACPVQRLRVLLSAAIAATVLSFTPATADSTETVIGLVLDWRNAVETCRTAVTATEAEKPCHREEHALRALEKLGWCYGRESDKTRALFRWHRCEADSLRPTSDNQSFGAEAIEQMKGSLCSSGFE